jgi:L-ornithine N5-oxygenase
LDADLVIVATGYRRDAHEEMLAELRDFMPSNLPPSTSTLISGEAKEVKEEKKWSINRDYSVQFEPGSVSPDAKIFLQGCNEKTHGLADSLLSILSVRGGEIVESIFHEKNGKREVHGKVNGEVQNGVSSKTKGVSNGEGVVNGNGRAMAII